MTALSAASINCKKLFASIFAIGVLGAFVPDSASAQTDQSTPYVQCAGLYLSVAEWAGETRMGPTETAKIKEIILALMASAAELRYESLGEETRQSVLKDTRGFADVYIERYQSNYAKSGAAFLDDEAYQQAKAKCDELVTQNE